jgi:predicted PolB exonuclease-like 3'-5' exonuclease
VSYLIFDIETVPDLTLWTPPAAAAPEPAADGALPEQQPLGLPGAPPPPVPETGTITAQPQTTNAGFTMVIPPAGAKKPRKPRARKTPTGEVKDPFAPHYAHRVIAIGWVWLDLESNNVLKGLGCVGTSVFGQDEAALLTAWDTFVTQHQPTVVSWNGRGFDVPVLSLRAIRHGIAQGWASGDYRKRYSDQHIDLFDVLTEFGALPRTGFSLSMMSEMIGLPSKGSVDGSKVREMFDRGEISKIEAYCASDAARTAFLFLRYRLMRGWLSVDGYRAAAQQLLAACAQAQLGPITWGIDSKRLLLEG